LGRTSRRGYRVTPSLIERVRSGTWDPEADEGDREQRNAIAGAGLLADLSGCAEKPRQNSEGINPGEVADADHGTWYRELFAPSVTIGLLKPVNLAGYRNGQVYIRKSTHVPLNRDAVRDTMLAFFDLLREEPHSAVRVVLGHFIESSDETAAYPGARYGTKFRRALSRRSECPSEVELHPGNRPV
jgi:hypothetical protein